MSEILTEEQYEALIDDIFGDYYSEATEKFIDAYRALHSQVEELKRERDKFREETKSASLQFSRCDLIFERVGIVPQGDTELGLRQFFVKYQDVERQLTAAQARITALEAVIAKQQFSIEDLSKEHTKQANRATQLEGALKDVMALVDRGVLVRNTQSDSDVIAFMKQSVELAKVLQQAQHALTPEMLKNAVRKTLERDNQLGPDRGVYREWCRDPKLCEGKNYCPKKPTCAD
jgi:uncharacterized coiled-coil protein SlyX